MSIRLAYVATHPIQYQAPLLRRIASDPEIDLNVLFLSDYSLQKHSEPAFGQSVHWDVPLTDGYQWQVLATSRSQSSLRWPIAGLKRRLESGNFDAVWIHGWGR